MIAWASAMPPMTGMFRSSRTRSKGSASVAFRRSSSAFSPSCAVVTDVSQLISWRVSLTLARASPLDERFGQRHVRRNFPVGVAAGGEVLRHADQAARHAVLVDRRSSAAPSSAMEMAHPDDRERLARNVRELADLAAARSVDFASRATRCSRSSSFRPTARYRSSAPSADAAPAAAPAPAPGSQRRPKTVRSGSTWRRASVSR